jgi:hypothetical protein
VVRHRFGRDIVSPHGDVAREELEEADWLDHPANDPNRP